MTSGTTPPRALSAKAGVSLFEFRRAAFASFNRGWRVSTSLDQSREVQCGLVYSGKCPNRVPTTILVVELEEIALCSCVLLFLFPGLFP